MAGPKLTSFEHILLGLICMAPSSGYDLKRNFSATPMGVYQPSSGTVYPALRRLEGQGLIQPQAGEAGAPGQAGEARQARRSARQRRVYEPTGRGLEAHTSWLRTPVEPATVAGDLGLHLMRFVMMEDRLPRAEVLTFLRSLADALTEFLARMEKYATAAGLPGRHPRLALDHGVAVHRASLRWAEHAVAALSA